MHGKKYIMTLKYANCIAAVFSYKAAADVLRMHHFLFSLLLIRVLFLSPHSYSEGTKA